MGCKSRERKHRCNRWFNRLSTKKITAKIKGSLFFFYFPSISTVEKIEFLLLGL